MTPIDLPLPRIFSDPQTASAELDALLLDAILRRRAARARAIAVGLCGAQGSGKSTMASRLARDLTRMGCPAAILSLDDFYLGLGERILLSKEVHPLFATRGVPGTHDVKLALDCLASMLGHAATVLPLFDKTSDDRAPESEWLHAPPPIDVIIVEGWCIGARPQSPEDLAQPVNVLERDKDPDGRWRRHVNDQLATRYAALFARLDLRVLLRAPSFEIVQDWRAEQEAGLQRSNPASLPPMDRNALQRFIAHFERLTRWIQEDEPADLVIDLDPRRIPLACRESSAAHRG